MKISQKKRKVGYCYGSVSGVYPFRGEKSIEFESTLERDLLVSLEFSPNVLDVIEQPVTIEYINHNGRAVTYTPDFLVEYYTRKQCIERDGTPKTRLIEVKPRAVLKKKWAEFRPRFKVATNYALSQGWIFKIYDESRIHHQYFKNLTFLNRYKDYEFDSFETGRILEQLGVMGHTAIDHLIPHLYGSEIQKGIAIAHIWHLIAHNIIGTDLTLPLNMAKTIWVNTEKIY